MRKELPHSQLKLVLPSRLSSLRIGCRRFRLGLSYSVSSEGFLISRHKAATGGDLRLSQKVCSCILAQRIRGSVGLVSGFLRGREPGNYKPAEPFFLLVHLPTLTGHHIRSNESVLSLQHSCNCSIAAQKNRRPKISLR